MIANAKILLVEDDNDLRLSLAEVLELEGYEAHTAASGQEAIRLLEGGLAFDLIISDHYMRNGSGIDLLNYVRARNPAYPPFFLMTGQSEMTGSNAVALGAQEFILKPFDVAEFFSLVKSYLSRSNWIASGAAQEA